MQKRKLLTSDQELTEKLREVLLAVFESFDADRDGALSTVELQAFARACNDGDEFDEDELEQTRTFFETDAAGGLTRVGFVQMYDMQTKSRPADTWTDLTALGCVGSDGELQPPPRPAGAAEEPQTASAAEEELTAALGALRASKTADVYDRVGAALRALGRDEQAERMDAAAAKLRDGES